MEDISGCRHFEAIEALKLELIIFIFDDASARNLGYCNRAMRDWKQAQGKPIVARICSATTPEAPEKLGKVCAQGVMEVVIGDSNAGSAKSEAKKEEAAREIASALTPSLLSMKLHMGKWWDSRAYTTLMHGLSQKGVNLSHFKLDVEQKLDAASAEAIATAFPEKVHSFGLRVQFGPKTPVRAAGDCPRVRSLRKIVERIPKTRLRCLDLQLGVAEFNNRNRGFRLHPGYGFRIGLEGALVLAKNLPQDLDELVLGLEANGITARGAEALAQRIPSGVKTLGICVQSNSIGNTGMLAFLRALPAGVQEVKLNLQQNHDISVRHPDWSDPPPFPTSIKALSLSLSWTCLRVDGLCAVISSLPTERLEILDLGLAGVVNLAAARTHAGSLGAGATSPGSALSAKLREAQSTLRKLALDLRGNDIVLAEIFNTIGDSGRGDGALRELSLEIGVVSEEDSRALGNAVALPKVEKVVLKVFDGTQGVCLADLGKGLGQATSMQEFSLDYRNAGVDCEAVQGLASGLESCRSLEKLELNLRGNNIQFAGAHALTSRLPLGLVELTLDLAATRANPFCGRTSVVLDGKTAIGVSDAWVTGTRTEQVKQQMFQLSLPVMPQTSGDVRVACPAIGADGALALGTRIAQMKNLRVLRLSLAGNGLGDEGGAALADQIAECLSLQTLSLDLRANGIGPVGGKVLGEALGCVLQRKKLQKLSLELGGNKFKDPGAFALGEALKSADSLRTLRLAFSFNEFQSRQALLEIAEGLKVAVRKREQPLNCVALQLGHRNLVDEVVVGAFAAAVPFGIRNMDFWPCADGFPACVSGDDELRILKKVTSGKAVDEFARTLWARTGEWIGDAPHVD